MAKPIFLIKLHHLVPVEKSEEIKTKISKTLSCEYHVVVACVLETGLAEFECFNAEHMPKTSIEDIENLIVNP